MFYIVPAGDTVIVILCQAAYFQSHTSGPFDDLKIGQGRGYFQKKMESGILFHYCDMVCQLAYLDFLNQLVSQIPVISPHPVYMHLEMTAFDESCKCVLFEIGYRA